MFCRSLTSFCHFSFGHCIVCPSSIYDFRLPLGIFKLFFCLFWELTRGSMEPVIIHLDSYSNLLILRNYWFSTWYAHTHKSILPCKVFFKPRMLSNFFSTIYIMCLHFFLLYDQGRNGIHTHCTALKFLIFCFLFPKGERYYQYTALQILIFCFYTARETIQIFQDELNTYCLFPL